MKSIENLSETAILDAIGERLADVRLARSLTQADLAREAGVSKRTVERLEAGASVQLGNFIRVLRALDLGAQLDQLVPELGPSPLDVVRLGGKERQRASAKSTAASDEPWQWGDESDANEAGTPSGSEEGNSP